MCSQEDSEIEVTLTNSDSGDSITMEEYDHDLNEILNKYEEAAQLENHYLLHSIFLAGGFQIGCGISPARTFSPVIILTQPYKLYKISFGLYEWNTFTEMINQKLTSFFNEPLDQYPDEYDTVTFPCGDFCKITQVVYDSTKFLEVCKHNVNFYLAEEDAISILDVNTQLLSHRINMLTNLNFCEYYYYIIDLVKSYFKDNNNYNYLNALKLLYGFCDGSGNSMLSNSLREYMYYYKNDVIKKLNE